MATDNGQYQFTMASPIASSGLDVDKLLAGDPEAVERARAMGIPFSAPARPATVAAGNNPPQPAGTSAKQPQPVAAGSGGQPSTPYFLQNPATESSFSNFGANLAQSQAPATNSPNPPADKTGAPTVPATVTPTGDAVPGPTAMDQAQQGLMRAGQMGEEYSQKLQNAPTMAETMAPLEEQRKTIAQPLNPMAPQYRPSRWQRFGRGVLAGVEGLAEHGIGGALLGAVDPAAVGATPYGAPNRAFSLAAQKQAGQLASIDQQEKVAQDTYKEDTGRAKDVITSINDIGKNYAAGETGAYRSEIADIRGKEADTKQQLADIKQQVADYQNGNKIPTSYEATVAAAHLEKDPAKAQALEAAAKEMAATEVKKFKLASGAAGGSTFRQSMIDAATSQVQALQDKYTYDPKRNQYVNAANPNDVLSPSEFTDKKNEIATKLDKDLGAKKMQALGVRFNPADAGAGKPSGRAARQQATSPNAPKVSQAKSAAEVQPGEVYKGYHINGGDWRDKGNWKPVKQ